MYICIFPPSHQHKKIENSLYSKECYGNFNMKKIIILIFFLSVTNRLFAQQDLSLSLSTIQARAISMGCAYTSLQDNIVSSLYNPATLNLYQEEKSFRITFFLNPITPSILFYEQNFDQKIKIKSEQNYLDYLKNLAAFIKGITITVKFLDLGFIFNEQIIDRNSLLTQKQAFKNNDLWNNCYHTIVARLKLAERVSLGASANLYLNRINGKVEHDYGFSYGIFMKPAMKMNVGVAYLYLPKTMPNIRMPVESLVNQTMNVGISYKPTKSTTLSIDLRNLTEDKRKSVREAHFGFEQKIFSN